MLSVIVPTYSLQAYLRDTLVGLLKQDLPTDKYEIIVVDNNPSGKVFKIVQDVKQKWQRPMHFVEEPDVGLHNARHKGAKEAVGDILVYIDDDVLTHPAWLRSIVQHFQDPLVAVVGGKILPKWEATPPAWLDKFGNNGGGNLSLLDLGGEVREVAWPQSIYGCNMAVRESVLWEVGGFHPDAMGDRRLIWLRGDGETGLQRKIYQAGYKVIYEPRAWVYHRVPASRLRPEYFYWRRFIQGISDSYTDMRQNQFSRIRLLQNAGHSFLKAVWSYADSLRSSDWSIRSRAMSWFWYGRAQHQLRLSLSSTLRSHVLQKTYLP